jgi:hypothetical protein
MTPNCSLLCKGHGAYKLQNQIMVRLASMLNVCNNGESMRLSLLISTKLSPSQHNEVGTWLIHFANIWLMYLSILNVYVLNGIPLHFPTWVWILLEPCNVRQWGGENNVYCMYSKNATKILLQLCNYVNNNTPFQNVWMLVPLVYVAMHNKSFDRIN